MIKHRIDKENFAEFKLYKIIFRKYDSRIEIIIKTVLSVADARESISLFVAQNEFRINSFNEWCAKNNILLEAIPINEIPVIGTL